MSPAHIQQAPDCSTSTTSAPSCARCSTVTTPTLPPPTTTTSCVSVLETWSATEAGWASQRCWAASSAAGASAHATATPEAATAPAPTAAPVTNERRETEVFMRESSLNSAMVRGQARASARQRGPSPLQTSRHPLARHPHSTYQAVLDTPNKMTRLSDSPSLKA